MTPVELRHYTAQATDDRAATRADAQMRAEVAADHAAELLIAEIGILADITWPGVATVTIDMGDYDPDSISVHRVDATDGTALWLDETCNCGGLPTSSHPEHQAARAIEKLFAGAYSFSPGSVTEIDSEDDDIHRYLLTFQQQLTTVA